MPKEIFEYEPHYMLRIEVVNNDTKQKYYSTFATEHREYMLVALTQMAEELEGLVV